MQRCCQCHFGSTSPLGTRQSNSPVCVCVFLFSCSRETSQMDLHGKSVLSAKPWCRWSWTISSQVTEIIQTTENMHGNNWPQISCEMYFVRLQTVHEPSSWLSLSYNHTTVHLSVNVLLFVLYGSWPLVTHQPVRSAKKQHVSRSSSPLNWPCPGETGLCFRYRT